MTWNCIQTCVSYDMELHTHKHFSFKDFWDLKQCKHNLCVFGTHGTHCIRIIYKEQLSIPWNALCDTIMWLRLQHSTEPSMTY